MHVEKKFITNFFLTHNAPILFLILLVFSSFFFNSTVFLGNDSFLYLRQAQNLEKYGIQGNNHAVDYLGNVYAGDSLRDFPSNNPASFSYLSQIFFWVNQSFYNIELQAWIFVVVTFFSCAFLIGLIVWLLCENKIAALLSGLFFSVSAVSKSFFSFDSHVLRLFFLLIIFIVFVSFSKSFKTRFSAIIFGGVVVLSVIVFFGEISQFWHQLLYVYSFKGFVSELRNPTLIEFLFLYPNIAFLLIYFLSFVCSFQMPKKYLLKTNIFVLYSIFVSSFLFFTLSLVMIRFQFFYLPLATIFVFTIYGLVQNNRDSNKRYNLIFVLIITFLFLQNSLLIIPKTTFFNDVDTIEATNYLVEYKQHSETGLAFLTGWNNGYYWQYKLDAPTFWDGGLFDSANSILVGKLFLGTEKNAFEQLKSIELKNNKTVVVIYDNTLFADVKWFSVKSGFQLSNNSFVSLLIKENKKLLFFQKVYNTKNNKIRMYTLKPS